MTSIKHNYKKVEISFFFQNYDECISHIAESMSKFRRTDYRSNAQFYDYLSRVLIGEDDFIQEEIKDDSKTLLHVAVKRFSSVLHSSDTDLRSEVEQKFAEWLVDPILKDDFRFRILACMFYSFLGNNRKALQCVWEKSKTKTNLPLFYLTVLISIKMARLDLASKALGTMREIDDLNVLTQISDMYYQLAVGREKNLDEVRSSLAHLLDRHGENVLLLNVQAIMLMKFSKFEAAEKKLLKALAMKSSHYQTLRNLVACQRKLKKPEVVVERYTKQLMASKFKWRRSWIMDYEKKEQEFDNLLKELKL